MEILLKHTPPTDCKDKNKLSTESSSEQFTADYQPTQQTTNYSFKLTTKVRHRHKVLLRRNIIPFAWPIFIELTGVVLMGMISTILVSRIGKYETAAVGISDSVTFLVISLFTAIALGGSVLIAQAFARSDKTKTLSGARQVMNFNILLGLFCLLIIVFFSRSLLQIIAYGADHQVLELTDLYLRTISFSYPALAIILAGSGILRAVGNTRLPMFSNISMNILNIVFSYPLIYGTSAIGISDWQGLGLVGAGYGITAARWIGALMIIIFLAKNSTLKVMIKDYCKPFSRKLLYEILSIGIPASIESLMFNVGKLLTVVMVSGMGTVAIAGNVITFSTLLMINLPGNALAMAATILIGKRLGQGKPKVAYQEMLLIFWTSTILMILFAAASVPFAKVIAGFYTEDPEVIKLVANLLYINALMMPIWAASFVLPAAFKGAKDVKYGMWTAIFCMWGCRICTGYLLGVLLQWGIYGIWVGMFVDWWFRAGLYFYRMISKKWLNTYYRNLR